jgi:hypothetical protein
LTNRRTFLRHTGLLGLAVGMSGPAIATRTLPSTRSGKSGMVQTVTGPISGDQMGFTAPHEHVLASSTNFLRLWPEYLGGRSRFTSDAVSRMKAAKAAGIDTIVDCTTADLGRDVRLLQEVARQSGVQIIATTGHWLTPTASFEARTADELAAFFMLEIERGHRHKARCHQSRFRRGGADAISGKGLQGRRPCQQTHWCAGYDSQRCAPSRRRPTGGNFRAGAPRSCNGLYWSQ